MQLGPLAAALARYRANERLSPQMLRDENRERFRAFARFAAEHSTYYAGVVQEHRIDLSRCRPEDFPPLTKTDLIQHFDALLTTRDITAAKALAFFQREPPGTLFENRYLLMHSSGTSGVRILFAIDQEEIISALLVAYRFYRHKGRRRSAVILSKSSHFPSTTMALASQRASSAAGESVLLDITMNIAELVRELNDRQPDFVSTYAGMMSRLAHEQRAGRLAISPVDIQVSGEVLFAQQRREIEEAFGANVVDVYSSCEFLYMGWRSSEMARMQLLEDNLIFEIHDDHVLCTNLFNRTLPLIRYRLDDQLELDDSDVRSIKRIKGRAETRVSLRTVHQEHAELPALLPYILVGHLVADERISAVQIAIVSDDALECYAALTETGREAEDDTLRWIEGAVRSLLESQDFMVPRVTARSVAAITPNASGKTPAMVDLRPRACAG